MNSFELQAFRTVLDSGSPEAMVESTLQWPVVLSESLWPEFREWLSGQSPEIQRRGEGLMAVLGYLLKETIDHWDRHPFGKGPFDGILVRLMKGEIDAGQAAILASAPNVVRNLSPAYLRARLMQSVLQAMNGDWRDPMACHRMILAALAARGSMLMRDQSIMECIGNIEYAYIAKQAIWETADGRYLTDAVTRLQASTGKAQLPWKSPGSVEFALAILHLDPYISSRSSRNFEHQMRDWMRRPREAMGSRFTADLERQTRLPSPLEAFTRASMYFLASANLETGSQRGLGLKGHIEAEVWKGIAGGTVADLRAAAAEALSLLIEDRYIEPRQAVVGLMRLVGQDPQATAQWTSDSSARARELLACDLDAAVAQKGLVATTELFIRVTEAVQDDRVLALAVWRKILPLVLQRDETTIASFLQGGIDRIIKAFADESTISKMVASQSGSARSKAKIRSQRPMSPLEAGKWAQQSAQSERWTEEKLVATLIALAAESQLTNHDLQGVELMRMAEAVSKNLAAEWGRLFNWFTAMLYRGEASNQFEAGNYDESMKAYALCALCFLQGRFAESAADTMEQGADLVSRSPVQVDAFVTYFGVVLPELERQRGPSLVSRIFELGRTFFPLTLGKDGRSSSAFPLAQMLKGILFGTAWRAGGSLEWIESQKCTQMLDDIFHARKFAHNGGVVLSIGGLNLDELLAVYLEETELASGDSPDTTLHNLEVAYDHELQHQIGIRRGRRTEWRPSIGEIQQALGPETVLIDYYSGNLPNGNAGLYAHIFSRESARLVISDFGIPGMQVFFGEPGFAADLLSLSVSGIRREIQNTQPEEVISEEARGLLAADPFVSGEFGEILKEFRDQGKWHLCIVPFGPSHFLPFHLMPYAEGLLGDEWAVTCLPTLALLEPLAAESVARPLEMASFGIEFKNGVPHGLDEIPGAEEEAQMVAQIFQKQAFVGVEATESSVNAALLNSQRIHLSTHGHLAVSAPSFQRVYLSPDDRNDGILYAWELLRSDLRGLDLLTLSACETALGRIDKGDNLRGFASNALIAGANTVIGTLWQVRSDVTKLFFETFYREIKAESGKREAFQTAQLATREKFPRYSDWGAFWYTGRW
jgi:CHAT domain